MWRRTYIAFSALIIFSLTLLIVSESGPDSVFAQTGADQSGETKSANSYPQSGIDAGVWNDGQAALWDLHLIDHFRYFGPPDRARGYRPEQPIAFSHVTHVQNNQIECQFCHWTVSKSSFAAIPEVETCAGCHVPKTQGGVPLVSGRTEVQKSEIAKIAEYFNRGEPIPWVKVHVMPDYVRFNHKRHVKAGVACQDCHGQIPEMPVVERVSSMKMGWCLSCHRQEGTSIDCYVCHY